MHNWRKYHGALIPSTPPHIQVDVKDINQRLIQENAYFARWTSDFDSEQESEFWYVICNTPMQMEDYSRNTRSKIRRAHKKLYVKQITKDFLLYNAYSVYRAAFKRYEASSFPGSKKFFTKKMRRKI